jgi:hypothetical protein
MPTSTGPGALVNVNGIMNMTKYFDIVFKNLVASGRRLTLGSKWIFQQDNNPKYTETIHYVQSIEQQS